MKARIGLQISRNKKGNQEIQMFENTKNGGSENLLTKPLSPKEALELGLLLIRNSQ